LRQAEGFRNAKILGWFENAWKQIESEKRWSVKTIMFCGSCEGRSPSRNWLHSNSLLIRMSVVPVCRDLQEFCGD
jgi:hypothetical protein